MGRYHSGKPYIVQVVHELSQFNFRKPPKLVYVSLIVKEFVELVGKLG